MQMKHTGAARISSIIWAYVGLCWPLASNRSGKKTVKNLEFFWSTKNDKKQQFNQVIENKMKQTKNRFLIWLIVSFYHQPYQNHHYQPYHYLIHFHKIITPNHYLDSVDAYLF